MNILTAKSELSNVLHGTNLNQVPGLYNIFNRAARQILQDIDAAETKRLISLPSTVYQNVYDYPLPNDLKGNKIIDIRPQTDRKDTVFIQKFNQNFDLHKQRNNTSFTIQHNNAVKTIRINDRIAPNPTTITKITNVTDNGTWTINNGTNLGVDNVNYIFQSALQFNLDASQNVAYIENSTLYPIDLSTSENQSSLFLYVFLPTAADFTSVNLRWGSDNANYYDSTTTVTQENTTFQDGWNMLKFNWLGSTKTGTPVNTAIDYARITFNYNGNAQTAVKANVLTSNMGQILECEYYSKYFFRDNLTGAFKETVTSDEDLINLDTENVNLFIYLSAMYAVQIALGQDAPFDVNFFNTKYQEALMKYKMTYKSEFQKINQPYYQPNKPTSTKFVASGGYNRY